MNILISNDDGIDSPGIYALAIELKKIANVTVVAPDRQQSAMGHALTISRPLRVTPFNRNGELFGYTVNGTPADSVKIALSHVLDIKPDLVVSGINHGKNTAVNILYSGTVSAATEGLLTGIDSIAFSYDSHSWEKDLSHAATIAKTIVEKAHKSKMDTPTLYNVNIPDLPPSNYKGIKVVRQGRSVWEDSFEERKDPWGGNYYWFSGDYRHIDHDSESDDQSLSEGYVTVTPLKMELTDFSKLEKIKFFNK
ncbi:MAG: 5'/3'-nucleotidase SurE [Candidatus Kapaibacteriales bacterium]